jgi:hypothetical protein
LVDGTIGLTLGITTPLKEIDSGSQNRSPVERMCQMTTARL